MTIKKSLIKNFRRAPTIKGAGGGGGGGSIAKNSLFSTDIMVAATAVGEGPVYRINPNGPQDIQINEGAIDSLLKIPGDGSINTDELVVLSNTGTLTQTPLTFFGDKIVSPQSFSSSVALKKGNVEGVPKSEITKQTTSASDWDSLIFNFVIESLLFNSSTGDGVKEENVTVRIVIYNRLGTQELKNIVRDIRGKTDSPFKISIKVDIPEENRSLDGYTFSISKISDERATKKEDNISFSGWDEIKYVPQAYPRTAVIGYALKAVDQYTGSVPNFTSLVKGLLVKVPSNYNQPILADGQIDWRQIEVSDEAPAPGSNSYRQRGYMLQDSGTGTVLYDENIPIYLGTWDGTFVYSWTQNPVWVIYDILTNKTYGLGIPEEYIDKYRFYQIAQYCDACNPDTGYFEGVTSIADGTFRYKPRGYKTSVKENQIGLPKGSPVKERRFISDISIVDQEKSLDLLNKISSTFRSILVYSGGKITLATDMPGEYPVMLFNDASIKKGSLQFAGTKESDIYTAVDVTYIEPSNHFKRESVRIDLAEANDGSEITQIDNTLSLDLFGVTRRSQAIRTAQYQIASSRYQRRTITFTTGTDGFMLSPGDVISVGTTSSGVAYGYGGKVLSDSSIGSSTVRLEHFTVPAINSDVFTSNTDPLALRVLSNTRDEQELYLISDSSYTLSSSDNVAVGADTIQVTAISQFNKINKTFGSFSGFTATTVPKKGDLWSIGEINPSNYYSSKAARLFKVTDVEKDNETGEATVSAIEYLSQIYEDSESFINYEPVSYTDITSPFSAPPTPRITFKAFPIARVDGTFAVDGYVSATTDLGGYDQDIQTDFYISQPESSSSIEEEVVTSPFTVRTTDSITTAADSVFSIEGKNGFRAPIGEIKLLCTSVATPSLGVLELTVRGLSDCVDLNFNEHVLETNDGIRFGLLKGEDHVQIPVIQRIEDTQRNFIGYQSPISILSRPISSYNLSTNKITLVDVVTGSTSLSSKLPSAPFYISISQTLAKDYYANNSFYVSGTSYTYTDSDFIESGTETLYIPTPIVPEAKTLTRVYIDGLERTDFTINDNESLNLSANVQISVQNTNSEYRLEIDYYTVPTIELGDTLEINQNTFVTVEGSSYDSTSVDYSSTLTDSKIYRIRTDSVPDFDLSGYIFTNVERDLQGVVLNNSGTYTALEYDTEFYSGTYNLFANRIYTLSTGSFYEPLILPESGIIPNLPAGTTSVKAQNRNRFGRLSGEVTASVNVDTIPIQKVQNITIDESIYREQLGGVAVRVTCTFDHIVNQEVTDYEISYRIIDIDDFGVDESPGLASFNSVKVSAAGVDADGKIRYTINNVNRGRLTEQSSIEMRITPLNRSIRGITATKSKQIVGKTDRPANIKNFTGGQQSEQVTFFWQYEKIGEDLKDLDLKEVIIRRAPGIYPASEEGFITADPFVTVSAGSIRKSVPIDFYGTYTYFAKTQDTSGNLSDTVVATTVTTSRPEKSTIVAAYSEDSPNDNFTVITNTNSTEVNYPAFNESTGGLSYPGSTEADNANASAQGWSSDGLSSTDLLATGYAEYITPIRDFGSIVTASIGLDIEASQEQLATYHDQKEVILSEVSDAGGLSDVLVDSDSAIGAYIGFGDASLNGRFDANNQTWMTGPASGNVWAIWNPGQFIGDVANANSYALIAGPINSTSVKLGKSFYANGEPTGSNAFSNVTTAGNSFQLVNLLQFSDMGTKTFQGAIGATEAQTFIRTSTDTSVYYANGNVNLSTFGTSSEDDGFVPYEAGTRVFRHFQFKHVVTSNDPENYNYFLDKFRYTVEKEQTVFSDTVLYNNSPTTVDISSAKFLNRPTISYAILSQADAETNTAVVVTTAASNSSISFKLFAANGTGEYPTDSTATIMITAIGV